MTTFSRTWDAVYKSIPENDDDALEGAGHIRDTRIDVAERMIVDHYWAGDEHDGKHKKLTFRPQAADPGLEADEVGLYAKAVGTKTELFFKNEDGNVSQMTFTGQSQFLPAGVIVPFGGTTAPGGFLLCHGQSVAVATYPGLFAVIGTTFGGDGVNNFVIPDIRGRVVAGKDNMGGSAAGRMTSPITGTTLGAAGGSEGHTLIIAEMPGHGHTINDPGHVHADGTGPLSDTTPGGAFNVIYGKADTASAVTGITMDQTGGDGAHNNVQPTIVLNYLIKT